MHKTNLQNQDCNNPEITKALIMKLAYERHESYVIAARMIIDFCRKEKFSDESSFDNLWHVLNLMSHEITGLAGMVESQINDMVEAEFRAETAL